MTGFLLPPLETFAFALVLLSPDTASPGLRDPSLGTYKHIFGTAALMLSWTPRLQLILISIAHRRAPSLWLPLLLDWMWVWEYPSVEPPPLGIGASSPTALEVPWIGCTDSPSSSLGMMVCSPLLLWPFGFWAHVFTGQEYSHISYHIMALV